MTRILSIDLPEHDFFTDATLLFPAALSTRALYDTITLETLPGREIRHAAEHFPYLVDLLKQNPQVHIPSISRQDFSALQGNLQNKLSYTLNCSPATVRSAHQRERTHGRREERNIRREQIKTIIHDLSEVSMWAKRAEFVNPQDPEYVAITSFVRAIDTATYALTPRQNAPPLKPEVNLVSLGLYYSLALGEECSLGSADKDVPRLFISSIQRLLQTESSELRKKIALSPIHLNYVGPTTTHLSSQTLLSKNPRLEEIFPTNHSCNDWETNAFTLDSAREMLTVLDISFPVRSRAGYWAKSSSVHDLIGPNKYVY